MIFGGMSNLEERVGGADTNFFFNTLAGLVKALEGKYTLIDLRNESSVTGKIVKVHGRMNVEMEDAVYYDSRGNEHVFPSFFLSERNIRYVHIPNQTSAIELIEKQINRMTKYPRTVKQGRSFKSVRAKKYNKEIIESAYNKEEENSEKKIP